MKINGKTKVSIFYKDEDESRKYNIENCTLNETIRRMSNQIWKESQMCSDYKNKKTQYIVINGKKYNLKTDINIECEVSMLNVPIVCKEYFQKKYDCEAQIEIGEFYNYIVDTIENYALALDTDMNNIKIKIKKLEILEVYKKEDIKQWKQI